MRNSFTSICTLVLFLLMTATAFAENSYNDQLIDMAEDLSKKNIDIETWNTTIKETIDQNEIPHLLNKLHQEYSVTKEENEKIIKYIANDPQKNQTYNEYYSVVIPKGNNPKIEFIAVLEGDSWSEHVQRTYERKMSGIVSEHFTNSKQIFSWLTFTDDGKMDSNVFLEEMIVEWEIQDTKLQSDSNLENRNVLYGYRPIWQEHIRIQNHSINVQVAVVTDKSGRTTYTIGTPILIHEY